MFQTLYLLPPRRYLVNTSPLLKADPTNVLRNLESADTTVHKHRPSVHKCLHPSGIEVGIHRPLQSVWTGRLWAPYLPQIPSSWTQTLTFTASTAGSKVAYSLNVVLLLFCFTFKIDIFSHFIPSEVLPCLETWADVRRCLTSRSGFGLKCVELGISSFKKCVSFVALVSLVAGPSVVFTGLYTFIKLR